MNQSVAAAHHPLASASSFGKLPLFLFGGGVIAALAYIGVALTDDLAATRETSWVPVVLLGIALLIALGFEFVNGFHDAQSAARVGAHVARFDLALGRAALAVPLLFLADWHAAASVSAGARGGSRRPRRAPPVRYTEWQAVRRSHRTPR